MKALIGSFLTCQMKVEVYQTKQVAFGEELYVCKTSVRNKSRNGHKGGIYFGTKKQIITLLRTYGKPAEPLLLEKFGTTPHRARFSLD